MELCWHSSNQEAYAAVLNIDLYKSALVAAAVLQYTTSRPGYDKI